MADLGISTGGDTLGHVLALGTNDGGSFTPDGIALAVEKVAEQTRVLAREIFDQQPDVDDAFFLDWSRFFADFGKWRADHTSWLSRAWNETRSELLEFLRQYHALRARWIELGYETASIAFEVKDAPKNTLEDLGKQIGVALKSVAIGLGVLVAVPLLGYAAWRALKAGG